MTALQEKLNFTGICTLFHICSWYSFRGSVLHDGLLYGLLHRLHGLAAHGLSQAVHGLSQAVHGLSLTVHGLRLTVHGLCLAVCLVVQAVLVDHLAVQETPVDELDGLLVHGLRRAVLWVVSVLGGVLHLLGGAVQCLLDGGVLAVVVVVAAVPVAAVAVVAVVAVAVVVAVVVAVAAVVALLGVMLHAGQGEKKASEIQVKSPCQKYLQAEMSETISGFSVGCCIERKVMLPT